MSITLIIGGARSGKSKFAEEQAIKSLVPVAYIATAIAFDEEMQTRIQHHQAQRPNDWILHECPLALTELLKSEAQKEQTILVDCLTLWLNNQLYENPQQDFSSLFLNLSEAILHAKADIIFVTNEVGLGIIPMGEVTRRFVDEAGRLNQLLAKIADNVTFMVAGLPFAIKQNTPAS